MRLQTIVFTLLWVAGRTMDGARPARKHAVPKMGARVPDGYSITRGVLLAEYGGDAERMAEDAGAPVRTAEKWATGQTTPRADRMLEMGSMPDSPGEVAGGVRQQRPRPPSHDRQQRNRP